MLSQVVGNVLRNQIAEATQSQPMRPKAEVRTNTDARSPMSAKRAEPSLEKKVHVTAPSPAGRAGEGEQSQRQRAPWKGPEGVGQGLPCQEDRPEITFSKNY